MVKMDVMMMRDEEFEEAFQYCAHFYLHAALKIIQQ